MGYSFEGILRRSDGSYYYDGIKLPQVAIPIASESEGTYRLRREGIDEWWHLPKYIIFTDTHSGSMHTEYAEWDLYRAWHYVNGGCTVYESIEWVHTVHLRNAIPKNELKSTFKRTKTKFQRERLYGKISAVMSASASYASMTIDASIKVEGKVNAELHTKIVEEKTEEGTIGDKPIVEVVLGMNICVKPVYSWRFVRDDV